MVDLQSDKMDNYAEKPLNYAINKISCGLC